MGIYEAKQGQLVKVAATLEEYLGLDCIDDYEKFLKQQGFRIAEEEAGAYIVLTRGLPARADAAMASVRFIFDVAIDDDTVEYIMVDDDLDAYLTVLAKLEPMVARGLRAEQAFERELANPR
ncbi:hypothetical protein [Stutzerimonas nitrititolerans]|jgi:hypothetical protein|uniref:hypothetical protein n=1 Tax=Stutzerimonas nitrititolerans TaxID=2482751 RepID=UPI0028A6734F|nr:hypothetical protein [Stutzerimonas nitrititolerans]